MIGSCDSLKLSVSVASFTLDTRQLSPHGCVPPTTSQVQVYIHDCKIHVLRTSEEFNKRYYVYF